MEKRLSDFLESTKAMKLIVFMIYFIINFLFLIKYMSRQNKVPIEVLAVIFILAHAVFYFLGNSVFKNKISLKGVYSVIVLSVIFYIILSNLIQDPYSLKIDRWQTAEYSLDYWLHGKYIYATKNFMGNIPSYLPGQLLLLVGFYLIGNVGYLQVASLILFSFTIIKCFKSNNIRVIGILLTVFSLSFMYEAVCKSDFISSFIVVSSFIILWNEKFEKNVFQWPLLLGLITGVLWLTRSVVVIPLILFLCRPYFEATWKEKLNFLISFSLTVVLLLFSVLFPAEDFDYVLAYNPLGMQGQSNIFVVMFFTMVSVILSFFVKSISHQFYLSTMIIFALMCSFIVEQLIRETTSNLINITYLAAPLPFCIMSFCLIKKSNNKL